MLFTLSYVHMYVQGNDLKHIYFVICEVECIVSQVKPVAPFLRGWSKSSMGFAVHLVATVSLHPFNTQREYMDDDFCRLGELRSDQKHLRATPFRNFAIMMEGVIPQLSTTSCAPPSRV